MKVSLLRTLKKTSINPYNSRYPFVKLPYMVVCESYLGAKLAPYSFGNESSLC